MYSQYGITSSTKIKLKIIIKLLADAVKKDIEDKLWQQWLVERPYMEEFISFENYKNKTFKNIKTENNNNIDTKKAIEEAEKIKNLDQKGGKR